MNKRYCDFCDKEINKGNSFIKLSKIDYATKEYKTYRDEKKTYQTYPQKVIADMCLKCLEKLKDKEK
jgi:hypothetical protein